MKCWRWWGLVDGLPCMCLFTRCSRGSGVNAPEDIVLMISAMLLLFVVCILIFSAASGRCVCLCLRHTQRTQKKRKGEGGGEFLLLEKSRGRSVVVSSVRCVRHFFFFSVFVFVCGRCRPAPPPLSVCDSPLFVFVASCCARHAIAHTPHGAKVVALFSSPHGAQGDRRQERGGGGQEKRWRMADSGGMTLATPPISKGDDHDPSDDSLTEEFRLIARCMSRALLRHPKLTLFHHDSSAMYMALHDFFLQWSVRQRRAVSLSLTAPQVECLLQYGESAIRRAALAGSALARARTATELIAASPLIPIEVLTQELQGLRVRVVLSAVAEIVELARVLDEVQKLRTPFGALNIVHLVALGVTLCPAVNMRTLLLLVATSLEHRLLCAAILREWSLIDASNAGELQALAQEVEQKPYNGRLAELVGGLLDSRFSGLGKSPTDPTVTITSVDGGGCHLVPACPADVATDRYNDEGPEIPAEEEESAVGDESETSDAVDLEFWRQLCS